MKKGISMVLTAVILFSCCSPLTAFADEKPIIPLETINLADNEGRLDLGLIDEAIPYTPGAGLVTAAFGDDLPSAYDSRDRGCITSVKNQGVSSDCWAFSAISAMETDSILKGYTAAGETDFSESHLAWFGHNTASADANDHNKNEGAAKDNPHDIGGNWSLVSGTLAKWGGVAAEADYPFDGDDPNLNAYGDSDRYNTGAGVVLRSVELLPTVEDAKAWIMEHGSFSLNIYYNENYYNSSTYAYYYNKSDLVNHAITAVGWDDNFPATNFSSLARPSEDGAWLCKDSWGKRFRNQGYFWVSYENYNPNESVGYTVEKADRYLRNYTYNGACFESAIEHKGTAQIANIFTAKGYDIIEAISTYTLQNDVTVKVSIYTGLTTTATNPTKGTLAGQFTTTLANKGYHTIELPFTAAINSGKRFSVVLQMSHPSGTVSIPIEIDAGRDNNYTYSSRETYLSLPGYGNSNWFEANSYGVMNVFVQAFTTCNHSYTEDTTQPTCTESGHCYRYCSRCGDVEDYDIEPTGHVMTEWDTSTDNGVKIVRSRSCEICGEYEEEVSYAIKSSSLDRVFEVLRNRLVEVFKRIINRMIEKYKD